MRQSDNREPEELIVPPMKGGGDLDLVEHIPLSLCLQRDRREVSATESPAWSLQACTDRDNAVCAKAGAREDLEQERAQRGSLLVPADVEADAEKSNSLFRVAHEFINPGLQIKGIWLRCALFGFPALSRA